MLTGAHSLGTFNPLTCTHNEMFTSTPPAIRAIGIDHGACLSRPFICALTLPVVQFSRFPISLAEPMHPLIRPCGECSTRPHVLSLPFLRLPYVFHPLVFTSTTPISAPSTCPSLYTQTTRCHAPMLPSPQRVHPRQICRNAVRVCVFQVHLHIHVRFSVV